MNEDRLVSLSRRELLRLLGAGGIAALTGLPAIEALAQSRRDTLVIGIDTSDSTELDPVRDLHYTPPMTVSACYETLVTMAPGDYINLKPLLATQWARTPDGKGWRFKLRDNVKFTSGNPMTAADVKFSLDRCRFIKFQSSQYLDNVTSVDVVEADMIDHRHVAGGVGGPIHDAFARGVNHRRIVHRSDGQLERVGLRQRTVACRHLDFDDAVEIQRRRAGKRVVRRIESQPRRQRVAVGERRRQGQGVVVGIGEGVARNLKAPGLILGRGQGRGRCIGLVAEVVIRCMAAGRRLDALADLGFRDHVGDEARDFRLRPAGMPGLLATRTAHGPTFRPEGRKVDHVGRRTTGADDHGKTDKSCCHTVSADP